MRESVRWRESVKQLATERSHYSAEPLHQDCYQFTVVHTPSAWVVSALQQLKMAAALVASPSQKFMMSIKSHKEWEEKVANAQPQILNVIDVYAEWCGPCTGLGKRLNNLSGDYIEYATARSLPAAGNRAHPTPARAPDLSQSRVSDRAQL